MDEVEGYFSGMFSNKAFGKFFGKAGRTGFREDNNRLIFYWNFIICQFSYHLMLYPVIFIMANIEMSRVVKERKERERREEKNLNRKNVNQDILEFNVC